MSRTANEWLNEVHHIVPKAYEIPTSGGRAERTPAQHEGQEGSASAYELQWPLQDDTFATHSLYSRVPRIKISVSPPLRFLVERDGTQKMCM